MIYLIPLLLSSASSLTIFLHWKNQLTLPLPRLSVALLSVAPLPAWIFVAGAEYGSCYYFILLTLCGFSLCFINRDKAVCHHKPQPGQKQQAPQKREAQRRNSTQYRSNTLRFILALVLPMLTSLLLMLTLPKAADILVKVLADPTETALSANVIIASIVLMLFLWPVLMIWLAHSQRLFLASASLLSTSALSAFFLFI